MEEVLFFFARLVLFIGFLIYYLGTVGTAYVVCWFIYKRWIKPQPLNAVSHGLVSAVIFGPVALSYVRMTEDEQLSDYHIIFVIGVIIALTFLMARPVVHGSIALWKKIKS